MSISNITPSPKRSKLKDNPERTSKHIKKSPTDLQIAEFYEKIHEPNHERLAMEQDAVTASIYMTSKHSTILKTRFGTVTHFVTRIDKVKEIDICYYIIKPDDQVFDVVCAPGTTDFLMPHICKLPPGRYKIREPFGVLMNIHIRSPVHNTHWVHCARKVKIITNRAQLENPQQWTLFEELLESEPDEE